MKVTIVDEKRKLHHLPTMIPGTMFGEIGLLCECKRTASVISDQYSTICNISKDLFQQLCEQYPEAAMKIKVGLKRYSDVNKLFRQELLK